MECICLQIILMCSVKQALEVNNIEQKWGRYYTCIIDPHSFSKLFHIFYMNKKNITYIMQILGKIWQDWQLNVPCLMWEWIVFTCSRNIKKQAAFCSVWAASKLQKTRLTNVWLCQNIYTISWNELSFPNFIAKLHGWICVTNQMI